MQQLRLPALLAGMSAVLAISLIILVLRHVGNGGAPPLRLPTRTLSVTSAVARENALPGDGGWQLDAGADTGFIQGYAGEVSALPGDVVPLYISTAAPTRFDLAVYRIGWYGGVGGRLLFRERGIVGVPQGTWTPRTGLLGCPKCAVDPTTHLVEARWQESVELAIGATWPSGVYLIKLTAGKRGESYIPLVVRDDTTPTAALANLPVNTYQAYNVWGGYSTYGRADAYGQLTERERAVAVSFDRPYDRSAGAGDFLSWDIHLVRWMERSQLDVSYTTDVDVDQHPDALLRHRIFVVMAHDEYYSLAMRDGVERARDAEVNLAFMGADAIYWQNRYQSDFRGQTDRTLVCYKVLSYSHAVGEQPARDPLWKTHPELVTGQWRDHPLNRPESALIGLMYGSIIAGNSHPDWVAEGSDPLLRETGLAAGTHVRGGVLGYEYDTLGPPAATPAGLVILARSPVLTRYGKSESAYSAYYRAASGALVFDAGSIWWCWGLDELSPRGATQHNGVGGNGAIARLTANIFAAMLGQGEAVTPTPAPTA